MVFQVGLGKIKDELLKENPSIKVVVMAVDISDKERVREVLLDPAGPYRLPDQCCRSGPQRALPDESWIY